MIQEYLDFTAKHIKRLEGDHLVITTGGFTNPHKFLGISEAQMMANELI